jgi:hypothetical protein
MRRTGVALSKQAFYNPLWGQERIANELWLKLGLRVSPRTVRKYLPRAHTGRRLISNSPRTRSRS